jgi:hypothetical protein
MSTMEQLVLRINALATNGTQAIYRELALFGIEISGRIKASLAAGEGPSSRSGKLSRAVTSVTREFPDKIVTTVGVFSGVPYARWMEDGTKPHVIYPRTKKALSFELSRGETVITKRVNHPGTPAYKFVSRQVQKAKDEINVRIVKALGEVK